MDKTKVIAVNLRWLDWQYRVFLARKPCPHGLSLWRYIATMLAQHVIALQTELHRPKPL
jgi:hypothetical protein